MNEPPWYIVPMDERPSNVVGQIYYYLDYGPRYVQHYLTRGPNTLLEFVEKKTGLPLQMEEYPLEISGFVEGRGGFRTQSDKHEKDASIGELRMQIEAHKTFEKILKLLPSISKAIFTETSLLPTPASTSEKPNLARLILRTLKSEDKSSLGASAICSS